MSKFAASNAHTSAVQHLIPGGAHTYAKGDDQYPAGMAPVIDRGAGCRVWDIDGNEFVEFGSGLRSTTSATDSSRLSVLCSASWLMESISSGRTGSSARRPSA